ncbi:root meristem growth factor 10 [Prosopis cineraria]|uniref:root meristem growth factor 10 n=1 Tax=Prosopis cineraria TaxID=364024 RepID=UPI00240FF61F|nr:root meristem growth factor 10 [Prosopis cineraria]
MSPSYLLLLLLLFLCFSFQTCNGRRLTSFSNKNIEEKSHFLLKNGSKESVIAVSPKQLITQRNGSEEEERKTTEIMVAEAENKPKLNTRRTRKIRVLKVVKGKTGSVSSSKTHESHVSVSWSVPPKKKRGYKNPGFNLDYSPPKTHPPSHN